MRLVVLAIPTFTADRELAHWEIVAITRGRAYVCIVIPDEHNDLPLTIYQEHVIIGNRIYGYEGVCNDFPYTKVTYPHMHELSTIPVIGTTIGLPTIFRSIPPLIPNITHPYHRGRRARHCNINNRSVMQVADGIVSVYDIEHDSHTVCRISGNAVRGVGLGVLFDDGKVGILMPFTDMSILDGEYMILHTVDMSDMKLVKMIIYRAASTLVVACVTDIGYFRAEYDGFALVNKMLCPGVRDMYGMYSCT